METITHALSCWGLDTNLGKRIVHDSFIMGISISTRIDFWAEKLFFRSTKQLCLLL